jgi:hypothetical protein
MKSRFLFPYQPCVNNLEAFALTAELARKFKAEMIVLAAAGGQDQPAPEKKDEIYCDILRLIGEYHGSYNQWNGNEVRIKVHLHEKDFNEAFAVEINHHPNLSVVIQPEQVGGAGLTEELMADPPRNNVTVFLLPKETGFTAPAAGLKRNAFFKLKLDAYVRVMTAVSILSLPEDMQEFREVMVSRLAG